MSNEISIQPSQPIQLTVVPSDPVLTQAVQLVLDGLVSVNAQLSQTATQAQLNNVIALVNGLTNQVNDLADRVAALESANSGV
ncbi:MAG: hypothetical protein HC827_05835 [Cyanobacteria bacterium RM1_2_2]|nr:hypothetical protein [Cyanobacteria bacterium RM1_2_2]